MLDVQAIRAMQKNINYILTVATMEARNANEAIVAPMVECGGIGVWRESGALESGGRFCVGAFDSNLASDAVKMFSHLIYFTQTLINCVLATQFEKIVVQ